MAIYKLYYQNPDTGRRDRVRTLDIQGCVGYTDVIVDESGLTFKRLFDHYYLQTIQTKITKYSDKDSTGQ
jgi:hypothetical protein